MKMMSKKGFTLMEMLIAVAIVAILIAIAIPNLDGAVDKSATAADRANLSAAYSSASVKAMTSGETSTADSEKMQSSGKVAVEGTESGYITVSKGDIITVTVESNGKTATYSKK